MNHRTLSITRYPLLKTVAIVAWLLGSGLAAAQTVIFIPGYLGDAGTWRGNGVTRALAVSGWQDAGHILPGGRLPLARQGATKRFFTLGLPTEAPLQAQTNALAAQVAAVRQRYPGDSLVLVGHSAGGVVARLLMVRRPDLEIGTLVTIAAPHLGTGLAETGLSVGRSPIGWFAPLVGGGTIKRSRALYRDLVRERPGTLLFWLNRQAHPEARYVSVVRASAAGDDIVPPYSQDMNNVPALRGKSQLVRSPLGHAVHRADGRMLIKLLDELSST